VRAVYFFSVGAFSSKASAGSSNGYKDEVIQFQSLLQQGDYFLATEKVRVTAA